MTRLKSPIGLAFLALWLATALPAWAAPAPPDQDRAIRAAVQELASPDSKAVDEAYGFLQKRWDAAQPVVAEARAKADGLLLIRLRELEDRVEEARRKETEEARIPMSRVLKDTLISRPTLKLLLAIAGVIASILCMQIFRTYLAPYLRTFVEAYGIPANPRTLAGIERLLGVAILLLGINLSLKLFVVPEIPIADAKEFDDLRKEIFRAAVFACGAYALLKVVDIGFDYFRMRLQKSGGDDDRLLPIVQWGVKAGLVVVTFMLVIESFNVPIRSLQVAVAIAGLLVAAASYESVASFLGSVVLTADRSFAVGDRLQIEGLDGYVQSIGLRSTRLRTLDGTLVTVPNHKLARSVINNVSRRPHVRRVFTLALAPGTTAAQVQKASETVREAIRAKPVVQDAWVHFAEFGPSSLDIQVQLWCRETDPKRYLEEMEQVNLEIKRRLEAQGIALACKS